MTAAGFGRARFWNIGAPLSLLTLLLLLGCVAIRPNSLETVTANIEVIRCSEIGDTHSSLITARIVDSNPNWPKFIHLLVESIPIDDRLLVPESHIRVTLKRRYLEMDENGGVISEDYKTLGPKRQNSL